MNPSRNCQSGAARYPIHGRQLLVRFACHSASLTVHNLPQYVPKELLEEAFSVFGQVERAVVIVDDPGRPSGKGFVEFSGKPDARKALDRCREGSFLLTTFPRPVTVKPIDQLGDEEGLLEKLIIKNQQFPKEREQLSRFAQPGSFECEYAMRWKALTAVEKQQQDQVDLTSRRLMRSWRWRFDETSRRASEDGGAALARDSETKAVRTQAGTVRKRYNKKK